MWISSDELWFSLVFMRKAMAKLRMENLTSKLMDPRKWSELLYVLCLISPIVSLFSWPFGNWENPLNAYHSLILGPYPRTLLWKSCFGT